jgi:DNA invertase Pin-like site-specific DNA recombinase
LTASWPMGRRRRFDVLVVTKLDRLARSVRHLTTLAAELEALGVDLVVLDQAIDTSTPSGRFLFNALGAVAELERDLIRERVTAGIAAAKRRGIRLGRPAALTAETVQRVARLHSCGHSAWAIAKLLGVGKDVVAREIARVRASVVAP